MGLACRRMERLRTLSEAECYERCYGWRHTEDAVRCSPQGRTAVKTEDVGERLRMLLELRLSARAQAAGPICRPRCPRARIARGLLADQPGSSERSGPRAVRESPQRLLAVAPRLRHYAAPARATRVSGAPELRDRSDERRPPDDTRIERPACSGFRGARERIDAIATDLRPYVVAFVGKAAYQGVFRERPDHGLQE